MVARLVAAMLLDLLLRAATSKLCTYFLCRCWTTNRRSYTLLSLIFHAAKFTCLYTLESMTLRIHYLYNDAMIYSACVVNQHPNS
jgi:hypothetical protein